MAQKFNNFKPCDPREIKVPSNLNADESEVQKVISAYNADGLIPDITITEDGELIEGINSLIAAIKIGQNIVPTIVAAQPKLELSVPLLINTELLYVHPLNATIYGENEDLSGLEAAISETGWIKTLVATPDGNGRYRIVSGNSCFKVGCKLGRKEFSVELKIFNNQQEEFRALLAGNVGREKTIEQKVREGLLWEKIEREEAKARQGKAGLGEGTVRDRVSRLVRLGSGVNYEHAVAAVKVLDETAGAPEGSVRHQQHQQLKQILSRTRGVDAAYKLIKPEPPPKQTSQQRWTPKILDKVKIIAGPHKGAIATVRTAGGAFSADCYIEGDPENKRHQIAFNQMEALPEEKPLTSVAQELKQKQKELGLSGRSSPPQASQLLPDKDRNEGFNTSEQPTLMVTLTSDEIAVAEAADKILKLTSKQLYEVMCKVEPSLTGAHLEAIWKALEKSLAHKAA
ncbi:hypothetical protein FD723_18850 [Nostoc sp. C052]|uniref:hypothetical protein n=1 Tax=Nostoc sp. C052 TaxID=2576902 RepID=UPI0015C37DC2|nr:hypothetical protein [Nostoc sp. C052]QLE42280.1 hypothetical protein FD723_18850 [Nostoc sp. C052]